MRILGNQTYLLQQHHLTHHFAQLCPACWNNYSVPMFNPSYICQNHHVILNIVKIQDSHFPVQMHCPPVSSFGSCSLADDPIHAVLDAFLCQSDYTSHTKTSRTGQEKRIRWPTAHYWPTNYILFKEKICTKLRLVIDFNGQIFIRLKKNFWGFKYFCLMIHRHWQ